MRQQVWLCFYLVFHFFFVVAKIKVFVRIKCFFFIKKGMYDCNVQIIVWRGSGIRFPCKYETPEKIAYVMCYTVLNWNDIWNRILIFETHDIRKITSISCISENENNIQRILFYTKKIWHLLQVFSLSFFKEKYYIRCRSFSQRSLSSVNIHSAL